jgi:hypothetical protein
VSWVCTPEQLAGADGGSMFIGQLAFPLIVARIGQAALIAPFMPQQHSGNPPVAVIQLSSGSSRIAAKYATLHLRVRATTMNSV